MHKYKIYPQLKNFVFINLRSLSIFQIIQAQQLSLVTSYIRIRNRKIFSQKNLLFTAVGNTFNDFADQFYRKFEVAYPKFHKMDNLCKLGFIGADILLNNNDLSSKYSPYDIGVILSNRNSSLDTDLKHHRQIQNGPASPAVFVYSLPNIVIGEICIRHGIKGDNTFFIEKNYNIPSQVEYITQLLQSGTIKACIGGWVELLGDQYDCFLYLVENIETENNIPFNTDQISTLYTITDE